MLFSRLYRARLRRRIKVALTTLVLTFGLGVSTAWGITVDQVIQMHKAGLPPAVILQTIDGTGASFKLGVKDVKRLKAAGVPKNVIDRMLGAGGSSASPTPEPAPEPAPDSLDSVRQQEMATQQQADESARVREAARRAAQAERQRMEAEERKRVAKALDQARNDLEQKKYGKAASAFATFIRTADPNKSSTHEARLGLADSLFGLKLYGNAAEQYHALLEVGADSAYFDPAFRGLRQCAKEISYNPVTLEALTNYFIAEKSQRFKDSYNYFVGKFFFDYNRFIEARRYLGEVTTQGADYSDAQYLLGLIQVAEAGEDQSDPAWPGKIIGASQYFQNAVTGLDGKGTSRVSSLAYLALARIAYSVELYDVAIFYYRKVPSDSTSYVNALHESGWSYFLKGDTRRGMGIFHTLDGPDWRDYFLPDMHLLEATVFMNACRFDYAHDALKRITDRHLSMRAPLNRFMSEHASPEDLYKALVLGQQKRSAELPKILRLAVLGNTEFYDLYTTVTQYRSEVDSIRSFESSLGTELTTDLLRTVESRQNEGVVALGIKINQILQNLGQELDELEVQKTEIEIEIDEIAADELEKSIKETYQGPSDVLAEAAAEETASVLVGDLYVTWPFEGEFWADEINSYRSDLTEVCK